MNAPTTGWPDRLKRLETLDHAIKEAASKVGLKPARPGFDGAGWAWIWPDRPAPDRVAEVIVRAQFAPRTPGEPPEEGNLEVEMSARAWLLQRRDVAWGETVALVTLGPERTELTGLFFDWIPTELAKARQDAQAAAKELEKGDLRRQQAMKLLTPG